MATNSAFQAITADHVERIRQLIFGTHQAWFKRWLIDFRGELADQIEEAGMRDRVPHLYHAQSAGHDEPFEVFVVGEVKFGKSTLINALIGEQLAPTDFVPKTWCFNRYLACENPTPGVLVLVKPGTLVDSLELAHLLGKPKRKERGLHVHEITRETADRILELEEAKTNIRLNTADPYVSPILEMEWQVATTRAILPGIRLVDTMGMNGMREAKGHLRYLSWQYARADAVIWLVSAKNLDSSGTREELERCSRYSKRVIMVVNRWDEVQDPERLKALAEGFYRKYATEIVYMSALAASVGRRKAAISELPAKDRMPLADFMERLELETHAELVEASGFPKLQATLDDLLTEKLELVRNESEYSSATRQWHEFRQMARIAGIEYEKNLATYKNITESLRKVDKDCQDLIESRCTVLTETLAKRLAQDVDSITYNDLESPDTKVHTEVMLNAARYEQHRLSQTIAEKFTEVFRMFQGPDSDYVESEFAADGGVAEVHRLRSLSRVEIGKEQLDLDVDLSLGQRGLSLKIGDFIADIPFIGDVFGGMFETKRLEAVKVLKQKIRKTLEPELEKLVCGLQTHLLRAEASLASAIGRDIELHAEKLGKVADQQKALGKLEGILNEPVPAPIWVEATVEALKERKWAKH
jgi:ribosome biogenesis GTPase A